MADDETFFKDAHRFCGANREALAKSDEAGCFSCMEIYQPNEIKRWIHDKEGDTAICPKCGVDCVIGDASGIQMTDLFLTAMHEMWCKVSYTAKL